MKNTVIVVIIIGLIIGSIVYVNNQTASINVDISFEGISYTLGAGNEATEKSVLKLKGVGKSNSKGVTSFEGTVEIDGKDYVLMYDNPGDVLSYASPDGYTRTYGMVYFGKSFSSVTVAVFGEGWSNEDGQMLTYPCTTKTEGLGIANDLMKEYLTFMKVPSLE